MGEPSEKNASGSTKIVGSDSLANETNFLGVNSKGEASVTASLSDSPSLDAFGRLRVSQPTSIFDCAFQYDTQPLLWSSSLSGGGSITHDANNVSVNINVGTASGDTATYQTRQYFKYHAGKSQAIVFTGKIATPQTNLIQRVGQFDASNGVFFQTSGTILSAVVRSSISGSVVDTVVDQASWNLDKLDGTGISGITIDPTKQQILFIDYQWLGSGRIRLGTVIDGKLVYAHQFLHANTLSTPYSQTATLPLRVEVVNTGITAQASTNRFTCSAIFSEGGYSIEGIARTGGSRTTLKTIAAATNVPIVSIRKGTSGIRIPIKLIGSSIFCSTADDLLIVFIINPTLTGATFATSIGFSEIDTAATVVSGGTEVYSFYLRGSAGNPSERLEQQFFDAANVILGSTVSGTSDIFTISARSFSGSASAAAMINFREIY